MNQKCIYTHMRTEKPVLFPPCFPRSALNSSFLSVSSHSHSPRSPRAPLASHYPINSLCAAVGTTTIPRHRSTRVLQLTCAGQSSGTSYRTPRTSPPSPCAQPAPPKLRVVYHPFEPSTHICLSQAAMNKAQASTCHIYPRNPNLRGALTSEKPKPHTVA